MLTSLISLPKLTKKKVLLENYLEIFTANTIIKMCQGEEGFTNQGYEELISNSCSDRAMYEGWG